MANFTPKKTILIKGEEGATATDTTVPIGGVIMYDGTTAPEGYEEVADTPDTQFIRKTTPSPIDTRPKVTDDIEYDENITGTAYSISCIRQVFNEYYPIGSIYISVNAINPASIFGGTWTQIKDKYLVCCGDYINIGDTGGSETATTYTDGYIGYTSLNVNQLPSHNHSYSETGVVQGTVLTLEQLPEHSHTKDLKDGENIQAGDAYTQYMGQWEETTLTTSVSGANSPQAHYHARYLVTKNTSETGGNDEHNHDFTGAEATFNTMPKYIAVNVWYRTA